MPCPRRSSSPRSPSPGSPAAVLRRSCWCCLLCARRGGHDLAAVVGPRRAHAGRAIHPGRQLVRLVHALFGDRDRSRASPGAVYDRALGAPRGVNLMWNTAFLLPGILLTPVTLLAGPQVSLTLVLTLSFAGSAAALFWVLRRWGASLGAAALGGAVYGFSPAGWPCRGRGPGPRCARGCRTMIWSRGEPLAEQTAAPVRPRRHRVPRDARDPRVPARSFPRRDQVRGWPRRRDRRVPRRIRRCRARCPGPPR